MNASVEIAMALEEMFEAPLTSPVDVLEGADDVHESEATPDDPKADPDDEQVVAVLTRAGYSVHPTARSPFTAISEDEDDSEIVLTGHSEFTKAAEKRARIMSSIGQVTRTRSVYVVDRAKQESVDGTALIERDELATFRNADDLRDVIRERSEHEEAA